LKQLFHTETAAERIQPVLSVMLTDKTAIFAITDKAVEAVYKVAYCTVDEWTEEELASFFSSFPVLEDSFYQVLISYNFRKNLLVPAQSFRKNDGGLLLSALAGINGGTSVVSEAVPEWQLYNVYAVPDLVHDRMRRQFPKATFRHQQSLQLRNINAAADTGCIEVDFTTEDFTVMAVSQSRLLYAGYFQYSTPADVIYYLLRICQHYSFSQQQVSMRLSGLIDSDSALYKELRQYFINTTFKEASWNATGENPFHFFTSLNELAKCAS
jgi:hypothetical protein